MKNKYLAVLAVLLAIFAGDARTAPFAFFAGSGFGTGGWVDVVDVQTQSVVRRIPIAGTPFGMAVNPNGARAYVSNTGSNRVSVIDTAAHAEIATVDVGGTTSGIVLSPAGDKLYVLTRSASGNSVLTVIITDNLQILSEVALPTGATMIAMNPQGTRVFAGSNPDNIVYVIDALRHVVAATIPIHRPRALATDSTGARLFVARESFSGIPPHLVSVVDMATLAVVRDIPVGDGPNAMVVNASGNRLFVTHFFSGTLGVVDLGSYGVIATVPVGVHPVGVDITPDGALLYIPRSAAPPGGLVLVDTTSFAVVREVEMATGLSGVGRYFGGPAALSPQSPDVLSGLWWNPAESGWGVHLTHRGNKVFVAWFTYDPQGVARWLVASDCSMSPPLLCRDCVQNAFCSGELFEVEGPTFFIDRYNPGAVRTRAAGVVQLEFEGTDRARMSYAVGGRARTVAIQRQPIDVRPDVSPPVINYTDLWWNPSESGWGIGITHQHAMMFLTWFVYDDIGRPVWYVASNCAVKPSGSGCAGTLYRTSGPPGPAASDSFDASRVRVTAVGSIDVTFENANSAFVTYSVDGVQGTRTVIRQVF